MSAVLCMAACPCQVIPRHVWQHVGGAIKDLADFASIAISLELLEALTYTIGLSKYQPCGRWILDIGSAPCSGHTKIGFTSTPGFTWQIVHIATTARVSTMLSIVAPANGSAVSSGLKMLWQPQSSERRHAATAPPGVNAWSQRIRVE
jgi:hypothetical protein